MEKKEKVLVIVGPTAVGKTALSVALAQTFSGEIISGDSLQIYRDLAIGTAKVTPAEQQGIPHYLIDEREMTASYAVADFQKSARQAITTICQRGKLPIVVGGTGLYIQALLFDLKLGGKMAELPSQALRQELTELSEREGDRALWERLRLQDEAAAANIHPHNVKRVMRAIELIELTGESIVAPPLVDFKDLENARYDVKLIGLTTEREKLYQRINQRTDLMMRAGLLEEARQVFNTPTCQAAQGIGYKEFFPYFEHQISLAEAVSQVKQNSRRYAKRQMTWFRNRMVVEWWDLLASPEQQRALVADVAVWLNERR